MAIFESAGLVLPAVTKSAQCADLSLTVQPYLPQLNTLPSDLWNAFRIPDTLGSKAQALHDVYLNTNPLVFALFASLVFSVFFFLAAEINKNYSQVDRFWSLLPTIYIAHYTYWAHQHGLPTQRLDNVLAFSTMWSCRLTFNYWRRGGYQIGSEDYRWEIVKNYVGPVGMFFFDATFIATAQNILLWSITTPVYILLLHSRMTGQGMEFYDLVFSRGLMILILTEFFADQQQWDYHKAKDTYKATAKVPPKYTQEDMERGFNVSGLWAWSRHPNFAAEQCIWVGLYQWGSWASDTYINWTFIGAGSYLILFQASTWLTELLSAKKYPEYKEYQRLVGKFLPKLLGNGAETLKANEREKKEL